jgi:hypothetical protein
LTRPSEYDGAVSRGAATQRDLFWSSLAFFLGMCLVAVSFRNLGWESRALAGRLQTTVGHVLASVDDGEICGKGGGCSRMYRTTVAYESGQGVRVFSARWGTQYQPGEPVDVEHAVGRSGMARMARTADFSVGFGTVLTVVCGLGFPLLFGASVTLVRALVLGERPDRRVGLVWLVGVGVALPLIGFLYWY